MDRLHSLWLLAGLHVICTGVCSSSCFIFQSLNGEMAARMRGGSVTRPRSQSLGKPKVGEERRKQFRRYRASQAAAAKA